MRHVCYATILVALMKPFVAAEVPTEASDVAQSAEDKAKMRGTCAYPCDKGPAGCCFTCSGCCLSCPTAAPCCISEVTCPVCSANANATYIEHGEAAGPGMFVQV
eukprot:TRINITY_DN5694_c0_g2_i1.p1 TRINITY_DN5694_c0_g2~~TRINITY_DN5694_c0_g2_i1.p1  ORF type:complete len:105 (+),score=17.21 TRINITY_DN5694_c0_g2_i1:71-385(+)